MGASSIPPILASVNWPIRSDQLHLAKSHFPIELAVPRLKTQFSLKRRTVYKLCLGYLMWSGPKGPHGNRTHPDLRQHGHEVDEFLVLCFQAEQTGSLVVQEVSCKTKK